MICSTLKYLLLQLSQELRAFYQSNQPIEECFQGYKIPFDAALDLVKTRQVVIKQVQYASISCECSTSDNY